MECQPDQSALTTRCHRWCCRVVGPLDEHLKPPIVVDGTDGPPNTAADLRPPHDELPPRPQAGHEVVCPVCGHHFEGQPGA